MNPLRALILAISRTPPAVMLMSIIGLAALVAFMVTGKISDSEKAYLVRRQEFEEREKARGKVVYAIKDVPDGQLIAADALEERDIEQNKIPADAITSSSLAAGRLAKYGISTGQIVSQHDLAPQGISFDFPTKIHDGMRAITFGVDNNSGVAGFVNPDSRVDIIAMVGTGADIKAHAVLADVSVIAVGQTYEKPPGKTAAVQTSSVTVALSPEDSLKLIKAMAAGKLYLTLRNGTDHTPVATVDITSLYARPQAEKPAVADLPPPDESKALSLPGPFDANNSGASSLQAAPAPRRPLQEVEMWYGPKKDVLSVPSS